MPANDGHPRSIEIPCASPHSLKKSLFLGATDSLVEIEAHRHASRPPRRHVQPHRGGECSGSDVWEMMLQVPLLQQGTGFQVLRTCDTVRVETRLGKTLPIKGAGVGRVTEHRAQLSKLVSPACLSTPFG